MTKPTAFAVRALGASAARTKAEGSGTTLIAATIADLNQPPRVLFSASGFNYYGARMDDAPVTEESPRGDTFLAEVCEVWEASTQPAEPAQPRW